MNSEQGDPEYDPVRLLDEAKELVKQFAANLPTCVDGVSLSAKSKIPFMAMGLRETLLYRITELAEGACQLYDQERFVAGIVLTRCIVETTALIYWLNARIKRVVEEGKLNDIHEFLMKLIFGAKDSKAPVEAFNILKAIDEMNKESPHSREMYDTLSEFAHPNWPGTSGPHSKLDTDNALLLLGRNIRKPPLLTCVAPLTSSLGLFKHYYAQIAEAMPQFIAICDQEIGTGATQHTGRCGGG